MSNKIILESFKSWTVEDLALVLAKKEEVTLGKEDISRKKHLIGAAKEILEKKGIPKKSMRETLEAVLVAKRQLEKEVDLQEVDLQGVNLQGVDSQKQEVKIDKQKELGSDPEAKKKDGPMDESIHKGDKGEDDEVEGEEDEEDEDCELCAEVFINKSEVDLLKCGHLFHSKCVTDFLTKKETCPICKRNIEIFVTIPFSRFKINLIKLEMEWQKIKQDFQGEQLKEREILARYMSKLKANKLIKCLLDFIRDCKYEKDPNYEDERHPPITNVDFAQMIIGLLRATPDLIDQILDSEWFFLFSWEDRFMDGVEDVYCKMEKKGDFLHFSTKEDNYEHKIEDLVFPCRERVIVKYQVFLDKWTDITDSKALIEETDFLTGDPGLLFKFGDQFYLIVSNVQVAVRGKDLEPGIVHIIEPGISYQLLSNEKYYGIKTAEGHNLEIDTGDDGLACIRKIRTVYQDREEEQPEPIKKSKIYQVRLDKWTDIKGSEVLAEITNEEDQKDIPDSEYIPAFVYNFGKQFYLVMLDFQLAISGDDLKTGLVYVVVTENITRDISYDKLKTVKQKKFAEISIKEFGKVTTDEDSIGRLRIRRVKKV